MKEYGAFGYSVHLLKQLNFLTIYKKTEKKIKHCTHKVPVYECSEGSLAFDFR